MKSNNLKKQKKKYLINILTILIFSIVILLSGCSLDANIIAKDAAEHSKIEIGVLAPLSGPFAEYGERVKEGLDSGANGVNLVYEDSKCEVQPTLTAYQKLSSVNDIHYFLGPACGSPQEALSLLLKDTDNIIVLPSAASEELYQDSSGNVFQIQYSLEQESEMIAKKTSELGYKKVVIISYANQFSQTHVKSFTKHYDGEILQNIELDSNTADIKSEILKIKTLDPQAIIVTDATFFFIDGVNKLRNSGIDVPIISNYIVPMAPRDATEGVIFTYPKGSSEAHYDMAYDASKLLSTAVKECEGEYTCVKNNLKTLGNFDENNIRKIEIGFYQMRNQKRIEFND